MRDRTELLLHLIAEILNVAATSAVKFESANSNYCQAYSLYLNARLVHTGAKHMLL